MDREARVWDLPVRVFHWALAASFAGAYLIAESKGLRPYHAMLGYTMLGLIAFRLAWGFVGTRYARFSAFLYRPREALAYLRGLPRGRDDEYVGHNPAGSWSVYAIMILAVLTGVAGVLTYNKIGGEAIEEFHEVVANLWLVVVGLHVAGVIASSLAHRTNLARAMVTGYKRVAQGVEGVPVFRTLGAGLAAAVLGFWVVAGLNGGIPRFGAAANGQQAVAMADLHEHDEDDYDEDDD